MKFSPLNMRPPLFLGLLSSEWCHVLPSSLLWKAASLEISLKSCRRQSLSAARQVKFLPPTESPYQLRERDPEVRTPVCPFAGVFFFLIPVGPPRCFFSLKKAGTPSSPWVHYLFCEGVFECASEFLWRLVNLSPTRPCLLSFFFSPFPP